MGDYDALVALFDELDEFHRQARPDVFRRFDGPARTREQIEQWLARAGFDGAGGGERTGCRWPRRVADAAAAGFSPAPCRTR